MWLTHCCVAISTLPLAYIREGEELYWHFTCKTIRTHQFIFSTISVCVSTIYSFIYLLSYLNLFPYDKGKNSVIFRANQSKSNGWMDERCFRPLFCTVNSELGHGQPGLMRWIWDETLPQCSIDRSTLHTAAHRVTSELVATPTNAMEIPILDTIVMGWNTVRTGWTEKEKV